MDNLYAFLNPVKTDETKEIIIADRFKNEDGTVRPFKIKALTQAENEKIYRKCRDKKGKTDALEYSKRLIVAATVDPAFDDPKMCEAFGTLDPLDIPGKLLLAGEYAALQNAIMEFSGFENNVEEITAKN